MHKIQRVFIANRGEIARRIALGAAAMGIKATALFSGKTPPSFLTGLVDHLISVPDESPALYLDARLMVEFAKESGCDALHPGFGFLSENAAFARLVEDAGLIWIGPTSQAIAAMASKAAAREIAKNHAVPVVPGVEHLSIASDGSHLKIVKDFALEYGFPILIKAALGGGGKGMRVVRSEPEIAAAIQRAQSEAIHSFGDGALIVERYLEHPRHIEVQIFGDQHGHIVALSDRDCSVQRRHQKIIEEAPAPGISPKTRERMHAAAIRLAAAVQYRSAGTVEFLIDWAPGQRDKAEQQFYFLEMNTRLQVEHPVTEEVTGEDLVAWQFRVAQGEALEGRIQTEAHGHSIELRLYAEDCGNQFLPAPGPIHGFLPHFGPGIRWEIGIDPIDDVTSRFDPMMAKLIALGSSRKQAIQRLIHSLQSTVLAIPTSNVAFLLSVLQHKAFTDSIPTTRFIEEYGPELNQWLADKMNSQEEFSTEILQQLNTDQNASRLPVPSPLELTQDVFQKSAQSDLTSALVIPLEQKVSLPLRHRGRSAQVGRGIFMSSRGAKNFSYCQARCHSERLTWISLEGIPHWHQAASSDEGASARSSALDGDLLAPVPGKVVKVLIADGSLVKEREILIILESMKMEFEVQASRGGTIENVLVKEGQLVQADELLATWRKTETAKLEK